MATDAQITANRENAQSSTGPVTDQGKARCALNAQTFGLFSKHDAIGNDEVDEYVKFCAEYHADLVPLGAIEHTLAAEIRLPESMVFEPRDCERFHRPGRKTGSANAVPGRPRLMQLVGQRNGN